MEAMDVVEVAGTAWGVRKSVSATSACVSRRAKERSAVTTAVLVHVVNARERRVPV